MSLFYTRKKNVAAVTLKSFQFASGFGIYNEENRTSSETCYIMSTKKYIDNHAYNDFSSIL